jgi:2-amino-4-hydroxy-6-hydroxymethyldihydropteridine diphosphokinase
MAIAYLAVGSNLGNRQAYLYKARLLVRRHRAILFLKSSRVYETQPSGGPRCQRKYLNAVWKIQTGLSPRNLLTELLKIEKELGRVRAERNAPRTVDLDILFYNNAMIEAPGLSVPHPRLHEREFVLKPLMEICPEFVHPKFKMTVRKLYEANR